MTVRSQRHIAEVRGPLGPPITGINPDTATLAAAGAIGRTVATLTGTGGTAPYTWGINNAAGLSITIAPGSNLITTTVNPYGTVGVKQVMVTAVDSRGMIKTEPIAVTVT
jgi:hypothetical protein